MNLTSALSDLHDHAKWVLISYVFESLHNEIC